MVILKTILFSWICALAFLSWEKEDKRYKREKQEAWGSSQTSRKQMIDGNGEGRDGPATMAEGDSPDEWNASMPAAALKFNCSGALLSKLSLTNIVINDKWHLWAFEKQYLNAEEILK